MGVSVPHPGKERDFIICRDAASPASTEKLVFSPYSSGAGCAVCLLMRASCWASSCASLVF
jgi:hypothetical protein